MKIYLVGFFVLEIAALCFWQRHQFLIRYEENSVFFEKNSHCAKIASGLHLTELTCVTMVRLPVFGYVKHITDKDKVSSCWRCGPDVVGVLDNFTEKQVWAAAMPAQYLTMENTVGNVIIGERINAAMPSGASVVTDPDRGRVLSMSGTDSCVTADAIQDFEATGVDLTDQWIHLGVTWGYEEGLVMYVNGVETGEHTLQNAGLADAMAPTIFVGCDPATKNNFIGFIDEVVIWTDILSPEFMKAYFSQDD